LKHKSTFKASATPVYGLQNVRHKEKKLITGPSKTTTFYATIGYIDYVPTIFLTLPASHLMLLSVFEEVANSKQRAE
jgi:hypothetical protein